MDIMADDNLPTPKQRGSIATCERPFCCQDRYDLVIVGAGLSGAVIAERASSQLGRSTATLVGQLLHW